MPLMDPVPTAPAPPIWNRFGRIPPTAGTCSLVLRNPALRHPPGHVRLGVPKRAAHRRSHSCAAHLASRRPSMRTLSCDPEDQPRQRRCNTLHPATARFGGLIGAPLSDDENAMETAARRMADQTPQCRKMAARTASSSKGLRRHSKIPSRIAVC